MTITCWLVAWVEMALQPRPTLLVGSIQALRHQRRLLDLGDVVHLHETLGYTQYKAFCNAQGVSVDLQSSTVDYSLHRDPESKSVRVVQRMSPQT